MFPNSPEREKLKHSLGRVFHHSVVSHGSPVVFGSDNILPACRVCAHTWCSHSSIPRRLLSLLLRTGTVPTARPLSPPFRLQPPNCGAAARKRFPDVRHELPDNRYHRPPLRALPKPPRHPRHSPGQVSLRAVPARWDTGAGSISNTQIPEWRDGNGTITCSNSCAVTHATAGTR